MYTAVVLDDEVFALASALRLFPLFKHFNNEKKKIEAGYRVGGGEETNKKPNKPQACLCTTLKPYYKWIKS